MRTFARTRRLITLGTCATVCIGALSAAHANPAALAAAAPQVCPGTRAGSEAPVGQLTATDASGAVFGTDPTLSTQQYVLLTVRGFAPSADVSIRLADTTTTTHRQADASGAVTYGYGLTGFAYGSYRMLMQGAYADPGTAPAAQGNVTVSVPNIGIFPFKVGCSNAVHGRRVTATLEAAPTKIGNGQSTTLTGTLHYGGTSTPVAHVPVELWSSSAGIQWEQIAGATTDADGTAKWTVTPEQSTRYRLRYAGGVVGDTPLSDTKSRAVPVTVIANPKPAPPKVTPAKPAKHGNP